MIQAGLSSSQKHPPCGLDEQNRGPVSRSLDQGSADVGESGDRERGLPAKDYEWPSKLDKTKKCSPLKLSDSPNPAKTSIKNNLALWHPFWTSVFQDDKLLNVVSIHWWARFSQQPRE